MHVYSNRHFKQSPYKRCGTALWIIIGKDINKTQRYCYKLLCVYVNSPDIVLNYFYFSPEKYESEKF